MYKRNSNGPKIVPCGTPLLTSALDDLQMINYAGLHTAI